MNTFRACVALVALTCATAGHAMQVEWTYHRTDNGVHPNQREQEQLWLINRARANPTAEGEWLAAESHSDVAFGRDSYFRVSKTQLRSQFAALSAKPPLCLLYTSPSPRDQRGSRMPSSA